MPSRTTTRERLITTAAELFWRQGYAQTGVSEIIQQADSTSGSFYHFFPAKEDLVLAVIDHVDELLDREVFGFAVDRTSDPIESVLAVLVSYRTQLQESGFALGSPVGVLAAEVSESHPRVRARIGELFRSWIDRFEALLDELGDRLPEDLDRSALSRSVLSLVEGAVLQSRAEHSLLPLDSAIDHLRSHLRLLGSGRQRSEELSTPSRAIPKPPTATGDWKAW